MAEEVEALLARMTLEEKAAFVAGSAMWYGTGVPRLGIPRLKVTDGPIGARGGHYGTGPSAACFPCGSALAATWSPELVYELGVALGQEARTKRCHVLLGPTVNMHRSPLAGRHFEGYSEDPHLAARIAVAFVRGVQSQGVGTSVKHFVCNDSEFERHTISSEVDERTLQEIYLPPFEAAVREAGAWTVMAAYNKVNGSYATEHHGLQVALLKQAWGFDGVIVSDWFAVKDGVAAAKGGLDLEMPGPPRHFGPALAEAVKRADVPEEVLDDKVRRLLLLLERTGAARETQEEAEEAIDRPAHRALARRAAAEAIVLLRNEGDVLPLPRGDLARLALIGPNAEHVCIQGGGSARVRPHYAVSPLAALRERAAAQGFELFFEPGCTSHRRTPALDSGLLSEGGGRERGFEAVFYPSPDLSGEPAFARTTRDTELTWIGDVDPRLPTGSFSVRLSGRFVPAESGAHTFSLISAGRSRLLVDGEVVIDNWTHQERGDAYFGLGSREETARVALEADGLAELVIEFAREGPGLGALRIGHLSPVPEDLFERAVDVARRADAAVVVLGLNEEWETEGADRTSLALPGRQAELALAVAAANPRTAVVVNAGAPVDLRFLARIPAALWLWYPGQEGGNALADVLFGDADPGGRLPTTFPERLEDVPCHAHGPSGYPGAEGRVVYAEGVFTGYRHYDTHGVAPLFPFGHGLSYARFEYGELVLSRDRLREGETLEARVRVRNAGARTGQEVVQLYVRDLEARVPRPDKELRAFEKLSLAPGEEREVTFRLGARDLAFFDEERKAFAAEPGAFEILVGRSSRDLRARARFALVGQAA
jgi:beta-glucosidase